MSDDITSDDVKALVKELQKLTQQKGSDSADSSRRPDPTAFDRSSGEKVNEIERRIEALQREKVIRGELSRQEERAILQLEQQKILAQEMERLRDEKADQLEKIKILEKEIEEAPTFRKKNELQDQLIQEKIRLEGMRDYEDQAKDLGIQLEKLRKAQKEANKEAERGVGKFELVSNKFLKVEGSARDFAEHMPLSVSELKDFGLAMVDSIKSGELFIDIFKKLAAEAFNLSMELDKVNAKLSRQTALFQETGTIMDQQAKITRKVERANAFLGVTAQEAADAQLALQKSMADFTRMSKSDRRTILDTATVMQELGINAGTSAQIFDKATKSLGYQNNEIRGIADELHATAQSLGVPFSQIAEDFNMVATELAFYGETAIDVFKDLSKQSKATGLSMQQLLKIGGQAFNTFDGAAQKVGRLNAILGGPYLNSIDMLNASEAERIDLIKQSMDASGQMFSDLSKYEQMAIADALGVSTEEARRLFGELSAAEEMDIRQKEKMEETARKAQATMDKLTNAFRGLLISMDPVVGLFAKLIDFISMVLSSGVVKFFAQAALYAAGTAGALLSLAKAFAFLETVLVFGAAIAEIVAIGGGIAGFFGTVISVILSGLATAAGAIAGFFGAIPIAVVAVLVGIGVALYSWFDSLKDKGLSTGEAIKHMFVKIVAAIGLIFTPLTFLMDIIEGLTEGVIGFFAALFSGKNFLDAVAQAFSDFMSKITGGITGKIIAKVFGEEPGKVGTRSVNDAIITTDGQIIEPSKQDTIFAARPGGPIMNTVAPILNLLAGGTNNNVTNNNNNTANSNTMSQQPSNVNVIVKVGERELRDIFIDVLRDTTASSEISGFGGR